MRATPGGVCSCASRAAAGAGGACRGCALRFVAERLRDAGYNSAICRTRWCRTPEIPSGNDDHSAIFFSHACGTQKRLENEQVELTAHLFFLVRSLEEIVV